IRVHTGVSQVTERNRGADETRNGAAVVRGGHAGAVARHVHFGRPHVEHRQVEVEVEHFARVIRFEEADLDGLAHAGRVDDGEQGYVVVVDSVIRVDEHRTGTIGTQVHSARHVADASNASQAGDDGSRQIGSFHLNTPKRITTGLMHKTVGPTKTRRYIPTISRPSQATAPQCYDKELGKA